MKTCFNSINIFRRMKIMYIIKDRYGNILIEFENNDDAKYVVKHWDPQFMSTSSGADRTRVKIMNERKSERKVPHIGLIKQVDLSIGEDVIEKELEKEFTLPCKAQLL